MKPRGLPRVLVLIVFFCKQKTAYEMLRGLVGSEMCIRDRAQAAPRRGHRLAEQVERERPLEREQHRAPVSYTHLTPPTIYSV